MAKIKDIISGEDSSKQVIKLYKEGIFYKAYEYSAYLFVKHIKAYQVKRKYSVLLKQDLVSIGFPIASFSSLPIPDSFSVADCGTYQELSLSREALDLVAFEAWKASISLPALEHKPSSPINKEVNNRFAISSLEYDVLQRLQRFNIDTATPMACMLFLSELKQSLSLMSTHNEL